MNSKPFWTKQSFIFTNSEEIKRILEEKPVSSYPPSSYDFEKLIEDHWYMSFVAVTKVIRNDLLIALHLTLDLYKNCLLLAMWLRDRETGTQIHRTGGARNDVLEKMNIKLEDMSKIGIRVCPKFCVSLEASVSELIHVFNPRAASYCSAYPGLVV